MELIVSVFFHCNNFFIESQKIWIVHSYGQRFYDTKKKIKNFTINKWALKWLNLKIDGQQNGNRENFTGNENRPVWDYWQKNSAQWCDEWRLIRINIDHHWPLSIWCVHLTLYLWGSKRSERSNRSIDRNSFVEVVQIDQFRSQRKYQINIILFH